MAWRWLWVVCVACDPPTTSVVFENHLAAPVYAAYWENASLPSALAPGASSDPLVTVAASASPAYVLLAPGWDPAGSTPPPSLVVLASAGGFAVSLGATLHVPIDPTFVGDCAAGTHLAQAEADFITSDVFPTVFAGARYDAATCTMY